MTDEIKDLENDGDAPAGEADEGGHEAIEVTPGQEQVEEASSEVTELRDELVALNDRHLRLAAEFDNYRKRNQRDRQNLASRLRAEVLGSLLEVLDDLERVSQTEEGTMESLLDGVRLVERKFRASLEAAGLERVDAEGATFDPEVMEALMMVPTSDAEKAGRVADVFQAGYKVGNALVRPAKVRVHEYDASAGSPEEHASDADA